MPRRKFVAIEGTKTCKDCHLPLHVTRFRVHQNYLDGRSTRCKPCQRDYDQISKAERALRDSQLAEPRYFWDGYRARCKRCNDSKLYIEWDELWCLPCAEMLTTGNQPLPMVLSKIRLLAQESKQLLA